MASHEILRGKVTAYPAEDYKGLVEVAISALHTEGNTMYARAEQSVTGVYWLPEIGDVVEVEVPDQPGYEARIVHIHKQQADSQIEECWTDANDKKQIKTRSGHTITFDDTTDATSILMQTAGGLAILADDAKKTISLKGAESKPSFLLDIENDAIQLSSGSTFTVKCGDATIKIDESGNVTIEASGKLTLSGQNIAISAKSKLELKGQQVEIAGAMGVKIEGKSQLQLSSSGISEVKGSMIKLN